MTQTCPSKTCPACGKALPLDEFYKFSHGPYYTKRCKPCHRAFQSVVYATNRQNPEWVKKEAARNRARRAQVRSQSGGQHKNKSAHIREYRRRNHEKHKAQCKLNNAVRSGRITKPSKCVLCAKTVPSRHLHGHHEDYTKPLEVVWLCAGCHGQQHRKHMDGSEVLLCQLQA